MSENSRRVRDAPKLIFDRVERRGLVLADFCFCCVQLGCIPWCYCAEVSERIFAEVVYEGFSVGLRGIKCLIFTLPLLRLILI